MPHATQAMQECIRNCAECAQACLSTLRHCLEKGGAHAEARHVGTLADCADICQTSANFMSRGSQAHALTCGVCAQVCLACARSCRQMADAEMEHCAAVCDRCAESCRRMAAA